MKEVERDYLDRIQIASPCKANWDEMSGDEQARFCNLCSLNVYNISAMNADDAETFLKERIEAGGRVCVTMYRRTDGTILTEDCPVGLRKLRDATRRVRSVAAAFLALLVSTFCGARGQQASPETNMVKGKISVPTKHQNGGRELGRFTKPHDDDAGSGTVSVTLHQPVLDVRGSLLSQASAWYSAHREVNTVAIRAVSSASLDVATNQRELEGALQKFAEHSLQASHDLARTRDSDTKRLAAVETAISLTGEGNCLYYLGKAAEATTKYEEALRRLEDVQFENKPKLVDHIFGNFNQSKRLSREKLDQSSLREKLGSIPVKFSDRGPSDGGISWFTGEDGACDFTEPLL